MLLYVLMVISRAVFLFPVSSLQSITVADKIVGLKSIAAYRSGLEINTNVATKDAEEGLSEVLRG